MKTKILFGLLAIILAVIGITIVLANENALLFHPKGIIAQSIFELSITNILLMLVIIVPTYLLLFAIVWKYCIRNEKTQYDPEHSYGFTGQLVMWGLPSIIIAIMAPITWRETHQLNPYKPIESEVKPLLVQVVALDWKWLFIYPEQGIATLNHFHIPEQTPIHLKLTADGAPMNSFWIPQLSGQIYSMAGMTTQLYLMANGPGEYTGRAVEINGEGYAGMTFAAKSSSLQDFENWVKEVRKSPLHLTKEVYQELVRPHVNRSVLLYSEVEENLYHTIVHKYMYPTSTVL